MTSVPVPRGCPMADGLYLRFNGQIPCWDHVGEGHVLRTLTASGLAAGSERDLFRFSELRHIRRSFMQGRLPFPDRCAQCAVLGHIGIPDVPEPIEMRVLHVEPSFACALSCPLCIPSHKRRELCPYPHHLDPELFAHFLTRLKSEGVESIRYVYFEGRGDPLMNQHLGRMVRDAKANFPHAIVSVVTHGNYRFLPWMVDAGLDELMLSVDGARQESYARYRVGGRLDVVLELMARLRDERRRIGSRLRVVWRYILFDWNDSDEELLEAAAIAARCNVELRFMRTHSEGHSRRFEVAGALTDALRRLGIDSGEQTTFELATREGRIAGVDQVEAEHAARLLRSASDALGRGDDATACDLLEAALAADPGIVLADRTRDPRQLLASAQSAVIAGARSPSTLSWLAAICRALGEVGLARELLARYADLAPEASDVTAVVAELRLAQAMDLLAAGDELAADRAIRAALEQDTEPPHDVRSGLTKRIRSQLDHVECFAEAPSILHALATLCDHGLGDYSSARRLYLAYLERAPHASDRGAVEARLIWLRSHRQLPHRILRRALVWMRRARRRSVAALRHQKSSITRGIEPDVCTDDFK